MSLGKKTLSLGIGAVLALGLTPIAQGASAITPTETRASVSSLQASLTGGTLNQSDLREIEARARLAGDLRAASDIAQYSKLISDSKTGSTPSNIITSVAKKALIAMLRYGGSKLPAKIRPYAWKIADALEDITNFQQGALTYALQMYGIPYDVAHAAAYWAVVFAGI